MPMTCELSGVRKQLLQNFKAVRGAIFDARDDARQSARVAFEEVVELGVSTSLYGFSISLAMTSR